MLVDLAEAGDLEAVRRQVEAGVNVNLQDKDGRVALHAALAEGRLEVALFLVERGANPHVTDSSGHGVLHWASRANSRVILEIARETFPGSVDIPDLQGRTPLSWAAQANAAVAIVWLLENGADPNRVDDDGWGPLHYAAADGNVEPIQELLRAGARSLLRLPPSNGDEFGHLPSDLARHFAADGRQALLALEAAEAAEEIGHGHK